MAKERGEEGETIEAAAFSLEIGFLADAHRRSSAQLKCVSFF